MHRTAEDVDYSHLGIPLDTLGCQVDLAVCKEGPELFKPIDASLLQILHRRTKEEAQWQVPLLAYATESS